MSVIKFGILGGDYRYKILRELLKKDGYSVNCYEGSLSDTVENIQELFGLSDVVIAPIPCSKDGKTVFLSEPYTIKQMLTDMDKNGCRVLIGGVMSDYIKQEAARLNIRVYDFFDMEELAVLNAIPTSEGAIQTAMEESDRTLFGSNVIVLGYGRCGKILSKTLKGIGAKVSVTYRKEADRAYITAEGMTPIGFKELYCYISGFDFIFNTIPALVLNREMLKKVAKSAIIIDLAQAPGGTDFVYARDLNLKALYCPGLPGRVAPYTAAEILKDAAISVAMNGK